MERHSVLIVGAGPAGLAASHELTSAGVEHVVLERGRLAQTWRDRWDSFCLVTPNWTVKLPGGTYAGPDPDGFMPKRDIVSHFEAYAQSFEAPVREGIAVASLRPTGDDTLSLETSGGPMSAGAAVVASGAFQKPHRPPTAATLPAGLLAIDVETYSNPDALPAGAVLVVGSGQTGCQIAEELNMSGRDVIVACGKAPWGPRKIGGHDIVWWVADTPFMEQTMDDLPSPLARLAANFQVTGRDGGHDLNYRTMQRDGITLAGRFAGADDTSIRFGADLHECVAWGDARYADVRNIVAQAAQARGVPAPELPDPEPFKAEPPEEVKARDLGSVIFTAGFRPDYGSWIAPAEAFDEFGFPLQHDGASTVIPGLYFMGTHFLRKRKSSTLLGMGEDAAVVASAIAAGLGASAE